MSDDPAYIRAVSVQLSRTLDDIGLNTLTVKTRRRACLYIEQLQNVRECLLEREQTHYHFGSQSEGTTTPGLHSDVDLLICLNVVNVIENWPQWQRGKDNRLMLQDDTVPGYCRLQLLDEDMPVARHDLPDERCVYDNTGRVILKNTFMHTAPVGIDAERNGPAMTVEEHGVADTDRVPAFRCNTWPACAADFTRRHRRHAWPSQRLVQEATRHGVFLVAVGYKLSPTEPLEWRISATLAERYLMFSLGMVHLKCYVILKMLVKTVIMPRVGKCITSYHCKTAVLHCTETTEPGFWRDDNLLQCVNCCLVLMVTWVTNCFCPQFIISEENLFAGKVTAQNRGVLFDILKDLTRNSVRALLGIQIDGLGEKLLEKLTTSPSVVPVSDTRATAHVVCYMERAKYENINGYMNSIRIKYNKTKDVNLVQSVYQKIEILKGRLNQANEYERQAIQTSIEELRRWCGSLVASISLSTRKTIPRYALRMLCTGAEYDVAATLKLASVLYCKGDLRAVEAILQKEEDHFNQHETCPTCGCYPRHRFIPHTFEQTVYALRDQKCCRKLFACCVRFSVHEMHCAPPAMTYELYRSVGDEAQHRHPDHGMWMDLAVVDCLPFMYFLQYLTYRQLGKRDLQTRSLDNLDSCIKANKDSGFSHLETAWNLLGHCMEMEQDPVAALACYNTSLEIRRRNNAAKWHGVVLLYKLTRDMF